MLIHLMDVPQLVWYILQWIVSYAYKLLVNNILKGDQIMYRQMFI